MTRKFVNSKVRLESEDSSLRGSIVGDESLQTLRSWCLVYILLGGILNGPSFLFRFVLLEFLCS